MSRNFDLPFKVGDEVEATFTDEGFRGAWFRCRVTEIKDSTPEPSLLLEYVDFPDEELSWLQVRRPDDTVYIIDPDEPSGKRNPLIWVVRPSVPIVHESNVEKYQEDIRLGRKCADFVHIYNDVYMVDDSVDSWVDDCFWEALVVEIITETNEAKIKYAFPPFGEGDGTLHSISFKDLRPSFTWKPEHWWRQVGLVFQNKTAGTSVENQSDKPHVQLVYLSGDSILPAVLRYGRCQVLSQGETSSVRNSEHDESAVDSGGTAKKPRLQVK